MKAPPQGIPQASDPKHYTKCSASFFKKPVPVHIDSVLSFALLNPSISDIKNKTKRLYIFFLFKVRFDYIKCTATRKAENV